ncbi:gallinacin-1 alpha-like [Melozone crissalis]|uniref:gallinacin-1 alpha-like n=1 Tax=Melozone crissalis TaxID=40204 RepID=UPI0023DCE196|nr:gallinacin-1 alpha-like [Melozone crissalis]
MSPPSKNYWKMFRHVRVLQKPQEDPGQASAMRILYLLLPLFLLLVHSAAGSSLAPTNKKECQKENGYCGFLSCKYPWVIKGKCSRFFYCCKNPRG